jgi:hypothetical protein
MKTHFAAALLVAVTLVVATNSNDAHAGVQVKIENKCGSPVPFKLERKGSTLDTSLSPRASITHSLDVGDKVKKGTSVLHTVTSSSDKQPVIICKP